MYSYVTISLVMKRLFAILLMLILPLQFSYAAASAYCEEDVIVTTEHYGHHDHGEAHQPVKSDADENSAGHVECGVCHLGCAKLLKAPLTLGTFDSDLPTDVPLLLSVAQHQPSPLQRPPIASLA
jgi:hypothetical protein